MKFNYWRIGAKAVLVAVLSGFMVLFERLVHPVASAASAVGQLADTVESSAQMTAYSWLLPAGWGLVLIVTVVLAATEIRAILRTSEDGRDDSR